MLGEAEKIYKIYRPDVPKPDGFDFEEIPDELFTLRSSYRDAQKLAQSVPPSPQPISIDGQTGNVETAVMGTQSKKTKAQVDKKSIEETVTPRLPP